MDAPVHHAIVRPPSSATPVSSNDFDVVPVDFGVDITLIELVGLEGHAGIAMLVVLVSAVDEHASRPLISRKSDEPLYEGVDTTDLADNRRGSTNAEREVVVLSSAVMVGKFLH